MFENEHMFRFVNVPRLRLHSFCAAVDSGTVTLTQPSPGNFVSLLHGRAESLSFYFCTTVADY
jgi:hypothetical protein